jgi:hypothetical protein
MKRLFKSFFLLALGFSALFSTLSTSLANFTDTETLSDNSIETTILDITLTSGQNNFVSDPADLQPGDSVARDIYLTSASGSADLSHDLSYQFISGNTALCGLLNLKIWYNHYHGPFSGGYVNRDMRLVYDGALTSLSDLSNSDFLIPHPTDQYDSDPSDGLTQWFYYQITLPSSGLDPALQNQTCNFDFVVDAWQAGSSDKNSGFTDTESITNSLGSGTWNDFDSPTSLISTTLAIQPANPHFNVEYQASDTTAVSAVDLYYSYQNGPRTFFGTDHPSPGSSVTGVFDFETHHGDGIYRFWTEAQDIFGNSETKTLHDYETLLDTTPPVITASLGEFDPVERSTLATLHSSNFEAVTDPFDPTPPDPWTTGTVNPAQIINSSPAWSSSLRGNQSISLTAGSASASHLSSTFTIPGGADPDTILSFWYDLRFVEGPLQSFFTVLIRETSNPDNYQIILPYASLNPGTPVVSGWQEVSYQLTAWRGKTVDIVFDLQDNSPTPEAQVLLDDITLSTAPHSISSTKTILFQSYDHGSGFLVDGAGFPVESKYKIDDGAWTQITGPLDPPAGTHTIYYRTQDEAGHYSPEFKLDIINNLVSLDSTPLLTTELLPPSESAVCDLLTLETDSGSVLDICAHLEKINEGQSVRVTLTLLPEEENLEYELIYLFNDQEQGIFTSHSLPVTDQTIVDEFDLATCSGEDCIYHNADEITLDIIIFSDGQKYTTQKVFSL